MSRLSKIIDIDKSKRFDDNFNPDEIRLMLENYYFNKMRNRLFLEYLRSPNEKTINLTMYEFEKEYTEMSLPISRANLYELKAECFGRALFELTELLKQE